MIKAALTGGFEERGGGSYRMGSQPCGDCGSRQPHEHQQTFLADYGNAAAHQSNTPLPNRAWSSIAGIDTQHCHWGEAYGNGGKY